MDLDLSVYPDLEDPPHELTTDYDKADYVARICGAWDYGIFPTPETFELFSGWHDVFDRFPVLTSSAYATFRTLYRWPRIPGGSVLYADYERMDNGRPDPCAHLW
jgi:hypothetical protein